MGSILVVDDRVVLGVFVLQMLLDNLMEGDIEVLLEFVGLQLLLFVLCIFLGLVVDLCVCIVICEQVVMEVGVFGGIVVVVLVFEVLKEWVVLSVLLLWYYLGNCVFLVILGEYFLY